MNVQTRAVHALPLVFSLTAAPAWAQDAVQLEKVEITGSALKRGEGESTLPLTIITREEIERSGVTSTAELVGRIAANNSRGFNESDAIADENNPRGFAGSSLRGLGANATLILLNGRRVANYAFGATGTASNGAVDLNSIPLAAVERVEVLRDGASALYGSDAIAGVINFVLRRDFRGVDALTYYGDAAGGGGQRRLTLTGGGGHLQADRYNVFAVIDVQKNDALAARERDFARTAYIVRPDGIVNNTSGNSFPANIADASNPDPARRFINPYAATGCTPPATLLFGNACRFDYLSGIDIINPSEKAAAVVRGVWQPQAEHALYAEASYQRNRFRFEIAPSAFSDAQNPFLYPAGGRYYPGNGITPAIAGLTPGNLTLFYRSVELGNRTNDVAVDAYRGVFGGSGTVAGWSYDAGLLYSTNTAKDVRTSGYADRAALRAALLTGEINPFGFSDAAGVALLQNTQEHSQRRSTGTTMGADVKAARDLYPLPAGPLALALGAEVRREKLDDVVGFVPLLDVHASRTVQAVFAEAGIPLLRSLETTLSLRQDRYSDFGRTTNPKIAVRWQPARAFAARASYGTGFRAPSLYDLHTQQTESVTPFFSDPVRCPVTGLPTDCAFNFAARGGGNPNLQPEKSEQATLGLVLQPTRDTFASVDYWKIDKSNNIGTLSASALFANFAQYDANGTVHRAPGTDPNFPGLPNPITQVDLITMNLGALRTAGYDIELAYRAPATSIGRFGAQLSGTYVNTFETQSEEGGAFTNNAGAFVNGQPVLRWRHTLRLNWDRTTWQATLTQNYQSGYKDFLDPSPGLMQTARHVGSYITYDVYGAYTGIKHLKLAAGVKNLFDEAPPYTRQVETFQIGYDPRLTDPRGRFYFVTLNYSFR
jgi:iron complex outermembrane receptor protein